MTTPLAIVGIGSRTLTVQHRDKVYALLTKTPSYSTVVSGGAKGADLIVENWAHSQPDINFIRFDADWKAHGKAAGPIRNRIMIDTVIASFGVDNVVVLAFVDKALLASVGTRNTVQYAISVGVTKVHVFNLTLDIHYSYNSHSLELEPIS